MIVGKAIYYLLTNATDVTDVVSTRIYPEIAQQDADLPYIVYAIANNEPTDTKPEPSKLDTAQVEVNIYSDSYTQAIDLAVAVRAALDRVKGTYNGVNVQSIQYLNEVIDFDEPQRAYNINADYDVRISRSGFEIAQGSPITGVQLGELSDVDVTGVTNGQLIAYNSTSKNWEAANDAGGAEQLNDLSDVIVSLPASGEVLKYDGGEFVNDNVGISDVTGLQAALDAAPDNLRELTDVTISGLADNDYLQYDSASGTWQNSTLILGRNGEQYTGNYDSEAETLLDGATETVELYYTAQADGDGLHEDAQTDTATTGYDIRRKLYYAEKAQADPNTSGDWTQFADIADDTTFASAKATLLAYLKARTGGTVPISLKMTWEEVAEAPTFTGLLNESYGSGATAAYSVRRLNGNYTGAAIQVERSSDNTTQDIGFDSNGDLDESALSTFCSGTVCKVRTWYGQEASGGTGSGNDAVQTVHANQPTIYTGGAIVKENGRVAVDFDGTDDYLEYTTTESVTDCFVIQSTTDDLAILLSSQNTNTRWHFIVDDASSNINTSDWSAATGTDDYGYKNGALVAVNNTTTRDDLHTALADGLQNLTSWTGLTNATADDYFIGKYQQAGYEYAGKVQELVLFGTDKSTDRTSIESNVGDYFTQNTPLLDTYTGAAAAYSLRKLRSAYSGSAIRVRRASDNAEQDIGFNVFGELDTVSLASFCSGTDGFVKTWYSQVGTGVDATQTATGSQPKIYDSATGVVTENGKPAVEFDGSNDYLESANVISGTTARSILSVNNDTGGSDSSIYTATKTNTGLGTRYLFGTNNNGTNIQVVVRGGSAGGSYTGNTQHVVSHFLAASSDINTLSMFVDNSALTLTTSSEPVNTHNDNAWIGAFEGPSQYWTGTQQELIIYTSDQSANRTNIEDNINTFYSIY